MLFCDNCDKKFIQRKHLANHKTNIHSVIEPAEETQDEKVKLYFKKRTGMQINGISYDGVEVGENRYEVIAKNMEVAGEIVRLARTAYGDEIISLGE